jgi:nucleotide-binding universal stress UspA family protein
VSAGIGTETVLRHGEPAEEIVREAQRARACLIVMGRHSRGTPDHWFLGSVAESVLRHAPCPVVVAKPPPRAPGRSPRRVICALDLGETSRATLAQAAVLTCKLGADLLVLHVVSQRASGAGAPGPSDGVPPARDPRVGLGGLVAAAGPASGPVDQRVVTGDPHDQIVGAACETGSDLIVVGSHGGRLLDQPFVGSTTLHLVRKAECDVVVVPALTSGPAIGPSEARSAEAVEVPRRGSMGGV